MLGVADEQRFVGGHPQQRFQVRIELADDVLRLSELHGVVAEQSAHRPFIEALAAAFLLGLQAERDLGADALLQDGRLALDQIVEVLLVAAADDVAHEIEELLAAIARFAVGLIASPEAAPQIQLVADVAVELRHERHAAVVLPALRAADPVGAHAGCSCGSPFSLT